MITPSKPLDIFNKHAQLQLRYDALINNIREYFAAADAADEAPDNPLNTEGDKQRAARRAVEAESKLREAVK